MMRDGQEQRVRLPIFEDVRTSDTSTKTPAHQVVLLSTAAADVVHDETGRLRFARKSYPIDMKTGDVTPASVKQE